MVKRSGNKEKREEKMYKFYVFLYLLFANYLITPTFAVPLK